MDGAGDQALDLASDDQPQQHAEDQDAEARGQCAGIERHRQFTAGYQQQMPGWLACTGQGDDLVAAKLGEAPSFDMPVIVGQVQAVAVLHLRQTVAFTVIQGRGAQWRVAGQFIEQSVGFGRRFEGFSGEGRVGHQATDGL